MNEKDKKKTFIGFGVGLLIFIAFKYGGILGGKHETASHLNNPRGPSAASSQHLESKFNAIVDAHRSLGVVYSKPQGKTEDALNHISGTFNSKGVSGDVSVTYESNRVAIFNMLKIRSDLPANERLEIAKKISQLTLIGFDKDMPTINKFLAAFQQRVGDLNANSFKDKLEMKEGPLEFSVYTAQIGRNEFLVRASLYDRR